MVGVQFDQNESPRIEAQQVKVDGRILSDAGE